MTEPDLYPTRRGTRTALLPRRDPVVHPSGRAFEPVLDPVQVALFETEGFVRFEQLIDRQTVEELRQEFDRLAADPGVLKSDGAILEPDSDELRSIFAVHLLSPRINQLVRDPRLLGPVRQVLGSDVYVHQSRINFKPGFEGREFAWHSDFETWHAEDGMPHARAVSISIALTTNYVCNGSLMVIPGSHRTFVATVGETPPEHYRSSLRAQEVGVPDHESLRTLVDQADGITTVTGDPGSAVMFDCNTMHGSAGNMTPYPRSNLFIVYNSVENPLVAPFAAGQRRPAFIASREFSALA